VTGLARVYCTRMSCTLSSVCREDMKCRLQVQLLTSQYISPLLCHVAEGLESFDMTEILRPFSAAAVQSHCLLLLNSFLTSLPI
jgi:hypothetical protein